jgi:pimeloyl-ACP methyl ester carboxylesterase
VTAESIFITSSDGLRLHARGYGQRGNGLTPVVCLPGLTRTAEDFEAVAQRMSGQGRRVVAVDYRGRGLSDYDRDPANYNAQVELTDVLTVLEALRALPAIFLGTSRGGILTMLCAAMRPDAVRAAILNDIGPVVEKAGLLRIKSYVGKLPQPRDYPDAANILRRLFGQQFPRLTDDEWLASAQRAFRDDGRGLVPTYDVRLSETLKDVTPDSPVADLWPQFDALAQVAVMVIRGALSDLLSRETVAAMQARRNGIEVIEVPGQGHAPLLQDEPTLRAIERFVAAV